MSAAVEVVRGGTVGIATGARAPDNRHAVLLGLHRSSGDSMWLALTWGEAREVARELLSRCGGLDSDEDGGAP